MDGTDEFNEKIKENNDGLKLADATAEVPCTSQERVTRRGKKEKYEASDSVQERSQKITNFFPVLKGEGRAKMCSSSLGDTKQKEILQKLAMAKEVLGTTSKAYSSSGNVSSEAPSIETPKKSLPSPKNQRSKFSILNSALKTSLSKVLRKSIEASDVKWDAGEQANVCPVGSPKEVAAIPVESSAIKQESELLDFESLKCKDNSDDDLSKPEKNKTSSLQNEDNCDARASPKLRKSSASHSAKTFTSTSGPNTKQSHGNVALTESPIASPKPADSEKLNAHYFGTSEVQSSVENFDSGTLPQSVSKSIELESPPAIDTPNTESAIDLNALTSISNAVPNAQNSIQEMEGLVVSSFAQSETLAKETSNLSDTASIAPVQSSKQVSKSKKNKKRHFRGGTYRLYLTPAKKRRRNQKKTDSGSKDDELSLAGTENGSYIDSEDGNSLFSEDFNTPSEKSLADDESCFDARGSPMLMPSDQNTEMPDHRDAVVKVGDPPKGVKSQHNLVKPDVEQIFFQPDISDNHESDNAEAVNTIEHLQNLISESEQKLNVEPKCPEHVEREVLKLAQYDDISNEGVSSPSLFLNPSELLQEGMEHMNENMSVEKLNDASANSKDSCKQIDCGGKIDDTVISESVTDVEMIDELSKLSQCVENIEDKIVSETVVSEIVEAGKNIAKSIASVASSLIEGSETDHHAENDSAKETPVSTIATCVKSRQRIKRRFTDDIVDTDVGILSLNSMLSCRKLKPDPPPTDIVDTFFATAVNGEARIGPLPKIECVFNTRQPPVSNCSCQADTLEANLNKEETSVYCQAVDSIDDKLVGCCNPVVTYRLVRPSVKIPFTVMCEMHLWRLKHHHCCPRCGLFCTQGHFVQCSIVKNDRKEIHLFHERCQSNLDDGQPSFCLHCGSLFGMKTVELELHMSSPPTFFMSQRPIVATPKAKMTFTKPGGNAEDDNDKSDSCKTYTIAETGKILSSAGLLSGPDQLEVDAMLFALNSENAMVQMYPIEEMHSAASEGDVQKLLHMLAQGFDPNYKFPEHDDDTALHAAAASGKLVILHLLVQAGGVSDTMNEKLLTPLMLATENGHEEVTQYLIKKGAFVDMKGEGGMSSLHLAARNGSLNICQIIMNAGKVQVNAQDDGGWTPIVWASEHDHFTVVKFLLEKGADPNIKDSEGNTGLHWAAFSGSVDICFLYLDNGCDVNDPNEHGDTPLHIAARQDSVQCVTLFLSRGASVESVNKANQLPPDCCADQNSQTYLALSLNVLLKKITGKYKHKAEKILHRDITRGKEQNAIQCVNRFDDEPPPFEFLYMTENCETGPVNIDRTITSLQSCHCEDDCTTQNCTCASISFKCWYDKEGCLLPDFNMLDPPMLFECNRACSCWSNCNNRVLQNGITCRLQLIRTNGKGWGVRALKDIPKGAFICEYVGELISDSEADQREDDSYLFDLDNRDGETYCLDARYYGNISRFINHLCEPNLVPVKVFVDHQDLSFPRIAFFSSREIKQYEELGFDYGEKFWAIKYKWFTCGCGSQKCKYSKDTIQETLANYYRRLKEEQNEEMGHTQVV